MHIFKSSWARIQIGDGFFGDMRSMVIQNDPDHGLFGVVFIKLFDLYDSKMQFCTGSFRQILFWHFQQGWQATEKTSCFELKAIDVPRISDSDAQASKAQGLKAAGVAQTM